MWPRNATCSYGKKHQCNSYICKMYVDIYEPKTSSTKMNLKKKNILCMPIKMSPAFLFKYFQPTCFKYASKTESSNLKLHAKSNSQTNRLIGFCVIMQSIILNCVILAQSLSTWEMENKCNLLMVTCKL